MGSSRSPGRRGRLLGGLVLATGLVVLVTARGTLAGAGLGIDVAVLALLGLGLQITYGLCGQLTLAVAPVGGLGGYVVARLMADHSWSFWSALPLAVMASAVLGVVVGLPSLRVRGDVLALVTLGAGEVLDEIYLNTRHFFGAYDGVSAIPPVSLAGHDLDTPQLCAVAGGLVTVAVGVCHALRLSPLGRAWRAVRDDEAAAAGLGIAVGRLRLGAFAVGSAIAGAGGALYAVEESFVSSTAFDLDRTVDVLLVVLLAGSGRMFSTVLAAGALTVLSDRLSGYASVSEAVTGALVLLVVAQRVGLVEEAGLRLHARLREPAR